MNAPVRSETYREFYDRRQAEARVRYAGHANPAAAAMAAAMAAIHAQASRTASTTVNREARHLRRHPQRLDILSLGMSMLDGAALVARAEALAEHRSGAHLTRCAHLPVSAAGVLLYARYRRRFGARLDRQVAA